ncbi:type 1 fimbrial protein [Lelliottia sp. CFBP8978]|uniref:type 1 fimbrial protein n=1 Tax=Lelliottia sp. CFBP8978 TaxID=3096522 RepID=UPI002A6B1A30|nr:type 1 fimbrial protein [Lelliottia sp. CFBP8978]MDY1038396.1 type 1 fimbrial protein [Lelliottia sp. CFBP8978]
MSVINVKSILGAAFIFVTTINSAFSSTVVNGGVIHFRGMIVEDPCVISPQKQKFTMSCLRQGKMHTTQISYRDALNGRNPYPSVATVSMEYINPQKSLAIVQIDYR